MEKNARLIVKVLRDVLAAERVTTIADAADALKFQLARLRIGWTPDAVTLAIAWVLEAPAGRPAGGRRLVRAVEPLAQSGRRTQAVANPVNRRPWGHDRGQTGQPTCRA